MLAWVNPLSPTKNVRILAPTMHITILVKYMVSKHFNFKEHLQDKNSKNKIEDQMQKKYNPAQFLSHHSCPDYRLTCMSGPFSPVSENSSGTGRFSSEQTN